MAENHRPKTLSNLQCLAYGLPQIAIVMLLNPIFVIQGVYVKYYGFSMTAMAAILLGSRVFDALTDPLVGMLSDWWKERTGRRKPFVALGAAFCVLAGFFIYMPQDEPSVASFTFWLFVLYFGLTVYLVPGAAWGAEVARGGMQKTRLFAFWTAGSYSGLALFYSLPLLPMFETSEITPDTLALTIAVAAAIMVAAIIIAMRFVPEGPHLAPEQGSKQGHKLPVADVKTIFGNLLFLVFLAAYASITFGLCIWYSMIFLFVDIYLGIGALFAPLYMMSFGAGIGVAFLCMVVARRIGNKPTWRIAVLCGLAATLATTALSPGQASSVLLALVLVGTTITFVSAGVVARAILGEIVDYSMLKDRRNFAASYFAVFVFSEKMMLALGGAFGLAGAVWLGFDPDAAEQSREGVFALDVVMGWVPAVFITGGYLLIGRIRMDERRHAIIRKRLDQRATREAKRSAVRSATVTAVAAGGAA